MANPVSLSDVVARYPGDLSSGQTVNATAWLADAWELVLGKRPLLETWIGATPPAPFVREGNVVRIVSEIVVRKLLDPEGKSMESIDDYRYERFDNGDRGLFVTDGELEDLSPTPVTSTGRGSVRLVAYGES